LIASNAIRAFISALKLRRFFAVIRSPLGAAILHLNDLSEFWGAAQTISTIVPLKDGNDKHVGVIWGGMNPSFERYGVRYYSSLPETFSTWIASLSRFQGIADKAGADVYLAIHPHYDKTLDKLHAIGFRKPGGPHPLVNKSVVDRFLTIMRECTEAQLARIPSVQE